MGELSNRLPFMFGMGKRQASLRDETLPEEMREAGE
jgi:hypothetical protein